MTLRIRDNVVHKHTISWIFWFASLTTATKTMNDVLLPATLLIDMETACTQPYNAGADWLLSDQQNERALSLVYPS